MRNRNKQVGTVIINFAFYIPFFPAGIRIAETNPEVIVGAEAGEKLRFMDRVSDPPTNTGCIVKDQQRRYTTDKFKDIHKPLADTFSGLAAKNLTESVVTVREGYRKIFLPDESARLIKVSFSEIHLRRTRVPDQFKVCFFCLHRAAFLHITLDHAVTAGISVFFNQTLINALCCMVLLAPVPFVLVQPLLDHRLERIQF